MCILSAEIVKNIIDKYRSKSPAFPTMSMEDSVYNLTLFFDICNTQSFCIHSIFSTTRLTQMYVKSSSTRMQLKMFEIVLEVVSILDQPNASTFIQINVTVC